MLAPRWILCRIAAATVSFFLSFIAWRRDFRCWCLISRAFSSSSLSLFITTNTSMSTICNIIYWGSSFIFLQSPNKFLGSDTFPWRKRLILSSNQCCLHHTFTWGLNPRGFVWTCGTCYLPPLCIMSTHHSSYLFIWSWNSAAVNTSAILLRSLNFWRSWCPSARSFFAKNCTTYLTSDSRQIFGWLLFQILAPTNYCLQ